MRIFVSIHQNVHDYSLLFLLTIRLTSKLQKPPSTM